MSVTLTTSPPLFAFSGDRIRANFTLSDIYENSGENAVNVILLPPIIAAGTQIVLKYGNQEITMTAAAVPDESGEQFITRVDPITVPSAIIAAYFQANYILQNDFFVTSDVGSIKLTSKQKGLGYDIATYTAVPGAIEVLKPNLSIRFILHCENPDNDGFQEIYNSPLTVLINESATAEAIINDKLHNYISAEIRNNLPDIPVSDPLLCKKSCRRYYFEFAESYGEVEKIRMLHKSDLFTVLHGEMSSLGQATKTLEEILISSDGLKNFLKQGDIINSSRTDQLQYLYFFNIGIEFHAYLKCKFRFTDGTQAIIVIHDLVLLAKCKYGFDVSYTALFNPDNYPGKKLLAYDLWIEDSGDLKITGYQTYSMDYSPLEFSKYFFNWSSWGTFDTRMFYGKRSVEFDLVQSEAEKSFNNTSNITLGSSLVYDISIQTKFSITTGFIKTKSLLLFNRDFFLSPLKYLLYSGKFLPIKVTSKSIAEIEDGNNLYAQKFEYQYLFDENAYTEGDIVEPIVIPPTIIGNVFFGSLPARPSTADQIKNLDSHSPDVYGFPLSTGTNRFFIVATPTGRKLGNVYDQTSEENVTSEYVPVPIIIDEITYEVNIMEMAVAYSINNDHIITLKNE